MKSKILLSIFLVCAVTITVKAQKPITTLQHNGTTTVFYGQSSFVDAYGASVNGDTLNLSTGSFTAPAEIAKGIKVYGSGHFPDSANVARRTTITSGLNISKGADSLRLEGLYINGDINYDGSNSINKVKVIRCRLGSANFNSSSESAGKNNCSYEECFFSFGINFSNYGDNFLVRHCVFEQGLGLGSCMRGVILNINENATIEGNIQIKYQGALCYDWGNYHPEAIFFLYNVTSSTIRNNIIFSNGFYSNSSWNYIANNISLLSSIDAGTNTLINNYLSVNRDSVFISESGDYIDYSNNYHLKNPELYLGTDGTQVGLYGGTTPFKDGGVPSNPQIVAKSIGSQTDSNGNLQISISVEAQDR
jgi:hypothetical protein